MYSKSLAAQDFLNNARLIKKQRRTVYAGIIHFRNEKELRMEKFIPYEKLSKKKRRELDKLRRRTWGQLSPVTRKPENPKAYNRQKARKRTYDPDIVPFCFLLYIHGGPIVI